MNMIWTKFNCFNFNDKFEGFVFDQCSNQFADSLNLENAFSIFWCELEVIIASSDAIPIVTRSIEISPKSSFEATASAGMRQHARAKGLRSMD